MDTAVLEYLLELQNERVNVFFTVSKLTVTTEHGSSSTQLQL